jgi:L-lactate dehydrogenase complex protein LldE
MSRPRVALFATCLIDSFRPQAGFAAAHLLEYSGCEVIVPPQTCCGQPAYNGGNEKDAIAIAQMLIRQFGEYDFVVTPSASCAGMIKNHYPKILENHAQWAEAAQDLSAKTHELFSFLVNIRGLKSVATKCERKVVYHDSCSSLREVKCAREARTLLSTVEGLEVLDMPETEICCGFGGLFSIKYPEISARMADDKIANAKTTEADLLIGPDLGCLIHIAGRLSRKGEKMEVRHAAEVLAGMMDEPALGKDRS